jgi:hypothetical protein
VSKEQYVMTRIRMVGLAVVAVFAVMAVAAASAMALNNENPVLVNSSGGAVSGVSVTGKFTGTSFLRSALALSPTIECSSEESVGTLSTKTEGNGMTNGTGSVKFKGCKSAAGKCTNGATAGEINNTVSILLVWEGKENTKTLAVLISILPFSGSPGATGNNQVSFLCSGTLVDVQGSFIALTNVKVNELFTTSVLKAKERSKGVQEDLTYTENGASTTNTLWTREGTGAFVTGGEETEPTETYSTSVKVIEN